jgi:hypothetical protein
MVRRRWLALVCALVALVALVAAVPGASPAGAQDNSSRKATLDARKATLDASITDLGKQIGSTDAEIAAKQVELTKQNVSIELAIDEYARMLEARKTPARNRLEFAIDAFVRGDPRINSLLAEIVNLEAKTDALVQRELYTAAVQDSEDKLAAADLGLRNQGTKVSQMQAQANGLRDQMATIQQRKQKLDDDKQKAAAERTAVVQEIEYLQSLANKAPLTGSTSYEDPNRPVIVVKIDNVNDARPQAGINQADVVFEEIVEGALTRLAAVFQSHGSDPVGPVRSARSTDVHLLANLNRPLLVFSGANGGVLGEIAGSTLTDAGRDAIGDPYFRDNARSAPHNLFVNTSDVWASEPAKRAGKPQPLFLYGTRSPTAVPSPGVDIDFGSADVSFVWNAKGGWSRSMNGKPQVDVKGIQAAPTNVIVQFTEYGTSRADENSPEARVVGSGDAWVFTEGTVTRGRWTRSSDSATTVYNDQQGNPIRLAAGTTWVELPRAGQASLR